MGNDLVKNYELEKEPIGLGGLQGIWKIYSAEKKDKGKQIVSVFTVEKKFLDKCSKVQREESINLLRKQAQSLAKFRHPSILSLVDPLLEDGKSMAFVTERVASCLINSFSRNEVKELYGSELELKMHIIELLEALNFLHNDAKTVSLGVSPENIFKTMDGRWKLGGFVFSTQLINTDTGTSNNIDFSTTDCPLRSYPSLYYSSPEVVCIPSKCFYASDIFSLGLIIVSILESNHKQRANNILTFSNYSAFKDGIIRTMNDISMLSFIPVNLKPLLDRILNIDNSFRPICNEISSSSWLNDPFLQTIKYLDSLAEKEISQQQTFLKGLQNIILKFEDRVLKSRILPTILKYVSYDQLSSLILGCLFVLMECPEKISKIEFNEMIWPGFKLLAERKEIPAQSLFLIVKNIQLLLNFMSTEELQQSIMPLVLKCYECKVPKLQELALRETEFLMKKLDFVYSKSKVLPRVLNLCCSDNIEIRRTSLFTLYKIYNSFDRSTLNDQILHTLDKMKKLGTDTKMNILILAIYEGVAKVVGSEIIGNKILPHLCTFLIDQSVSKSEFVAFNKTIQFLLKKIEEERMQGFAAIPNSEEITLEKILNEYNEKTEKAGVKLEMKKKESHVNANQMPDFDFLTNMTSTSSNGNNVNQIQSNPFDLGNFGGSQIGGGGMPDFTSFGQSIETPKNIIQPKIQNENGFSNDPFFNGITKISPSNDKPLSSMTLKKPNPKPVNSNIQLGGGFDFLDNPNQSSFNNQPASDMFNSMNIKPNQGNINGKPQGIKGNMTKLNYDPFADLEGSKIGAGLNLNSSNNLQTNAPWGNVNPIQPMSNPFGNVTNDSGWNLQSLDFGNQKPIEIKNTVPPKKPALSNNPFHNSDMLDLI